MPRSSIVRDYNNPQPGETDHMTLDDRMLASALANDIKRPQGYTVSYHANADVEDHHFGQTHPMKPWRLTLTQKIVMAYGMHHAMDTYNSRPATEQEILNFHTLDYVDALKKVDPIKQLPGYTLPDLTHLGFGDDCPIFDGLYEYCALYTGASLDAARCLTSGQSQIAVNWSGGLHHAKKSEASGFCYVNDIVIAIMQLLLYHPRVLYIDIDVHHGDGVEQAFWSTNRVMTASFHKYDKETFFPGTGPLDSTGPLNLSNPGAHHSVNVPLNDGVDDAQYVQLFKDVIGACVEFYRPTAIVLQCGADSLGGDRLGCFNLNIKAHGACVEYTKTFGLPLLIMGGGGYTPKNVSRVWAYETAIAIGAQADINASLPAHTPFLSHFAPDRSLFPPLSEFRRYDNKNSRQYVESLVAGVRESLRYLEGAPSVQMAVIPPDVGLLTSEGDIEAKIIAEEKGLGRRMKEEGLGVRGEMEVN